MNAFNNDSSSSHLKWKYKEIETVWLKVNSWLTKFVEMNTINLFNICITWYVIIWSVLFDKKKPFDTVTNQVAMLKESLTLTITTFVNSRDYKLTTTMATHRSAKVHSLVVVLPTIMLFLTWYFIFRNQLHLWQKQLWAYHWLCVLITFSYTCNIAWNTKIDRLFKQMWFHFKLSIS